MTLPEVMKSLESLGNEATRKTYRRHGEGDNVFGVSFANLYVLKKKIKTDHFLALKLWDTGVAEARFLATMIADPAAATSAELDRFASTVASYGLAQLLAGYVANTPFAEEKMREWMQSKHEFVAQAGWNVLARVATNESALTDKYCEERLAHIEKNIHKSANRVRYAMNGAVIAIGLRNEALRKSALAAAARIGKVSVDHGDTDCKTPDAASYIAKAAARNAAKKKKAASA